MKRLARIGGALLFACGGLPLLDAVPALAAPATPQAPTFVCTPGMGIQTCGALTVLEGALIQMGMSQGAIDVYLAGILTYAMGGTMDELLQMEQLCWTDPACTSPLKSRVQADAQRVKEAAKVDQQVADGDLSGDERAFLCALFPSWEGCPSGATGTSPAGFWASGGAGSYQGPIAAAAKMPHTDNGPAWSITFAGTITEAMFAGGSTITVARYANDNGRYASVQMTVASAGGVPTGITATVNSYGNNTGDQPTATATRSMTSWGQTFALVLLHSAGSSGVGARFGNSAGVSAIVPAEVRGGAVAACCPDAPMASNFFSSDAGSGFFTYRTEAGSAGWEMQTHYDTAALTATTAGAKLAVLDPATDLTAPEFIYPFPNPELDNPTHTPPVASPTVPAPPALDPTPTPTPSTQVQVSGDTEKGWLETLGNRIGGMFDGLGSMIGSAFGWLGDLFWDAIVWLAGQIRLMFQWLGDQLWAAVEWLAATLAHWLGLIYDALQLMTSMLAALLGSIINAIGSLGIQLATWLQTIAQAVLALPGLLLDGFEALLQALFVPQAAPALRSCADTFPCNWVAEVNDTMSTVQGGIAGIGGCQAPTIGWTEFTVSFPPPPGCSGGNAGAAGANDAVAGDLFGWRTTIRTVLAIALWLGFIRKVLALAPWSREGDMPLGEGQVTV